MPAVKKIIAASFAFLCLCLPGSSQTAEVTNNNHDANLIGKILAPPTHPYKGHLLISSWSGKDTRSEDVRIYFTPPDRYRLEFLSPNGVVDRTVLSDGSREQVLVKGDGHTLQDSIAPLVNPLIQTEQEKNLLLQNYKVTVHDGGNIIGRPTWTVELTPLVAGKPSHLLRVDRATYMILEAKQFTSDGTTGSSMHFIDFQPAAKMADSLFLPGGNLKPEADETTVSESTEKSFKVTPKLGGGFLLQSINHFEITGNTVQHARYTDGILPLSLFQTSKPVKLPTQGFVSLTDQRPMQIGSSTEGRVCTWEKNKEYFTLIGDVQDNLLQEIAKGLQ